MRLGFFGSPQFALPALAALAEMQAEPVQIWARPPARAGRGKKMQFCPVADYARAHNIPLRMPQTLAGEAGEAEAAFIKNLALDALITAAYGQILPAAILSATPIGGINLHASLLPRWRGADPVRHAILAGDEKTGISLMKMEAGLDNGPVYAHAELAIGTQNAGELRTGLAELSADLVRQHLPAILAGEIKPAPQNHALATKAGKLPPEIWRIDWQEDAENLARLVQAGAPNPAAWCVLPGEADRHDLRLALLAARARKTEPHETGAAGTLLDRKGAVLTGKGVLEILSLRPAGGKSMKMADFINGRRLQAGAKLGNAALSFKA